jgi:hypothetical protein
VSPAAGWYADPRSVGRLRWWDGSRWTEHVTSAPGAGPPTGAAPPLGGDSEGGTPVPASRSTAARGWYTDPSGAAGQLRWWDGDRWTDEVAEDPGRGGHPPADVPADVTEPKVTPPASAPDAAVEEVPEPTPGSAVRDEVELELTPEPIPSSARTSRPAAAAGPPLRGEAVPDPGRSRTRPTALALLAVVGVALVGLSVAGLVGDDDPETAPSADEAGEDPGGGSIAVGTSLEGVVPEEGTFEIEVVVTAEGPVTIDVRAVGEEWDPVAELTDLEGAAVAYNDDRGEAAAERVGGDYYDPLIVTELEPGTYRLIVRGFQSDAGPFELRTS